jgi:hypothetical protein
MLVTHRSHHLSCQKEKVEVGRHRSKESGNSSGSLPALVLKEDLSVPGHLLAMHKARRNFETFISDDSTGVGNDLLTLLSLRRGLGVSDARDMIYAHLGIASDSLSGQLCLKVDYHKSCAELFTDIALYFIEHYGDYRVLNYVEDVPLGKRRQNLPSWVPDWTSSKANDVPDVRNLGTKSPPSPAVFSFPRSLDGRRQLKCTGEIATRIKILGSKVLRFAHFTQEEINSAWLGDLLDTPGDKLQGEYRAQIRLNLKRGFDRLATELVEVAGLAESQEALTSLSRLRYLWDSRVYSLSPWMLGSAVHPLAFLSTLTFHSWLKREAGIYRVRADYQNSRADTHPSLNVPSWALEERRLCVCDKTFWSNIHQYPPYRLGDVVVVPQSAQVGDFICQLTQNHIFVVLRTVEPTANYEDETTTFAFVGMCFGESYTNGVTFQRDFLLQ